MSDSLISHNGDILEQLFTPNIEQAISRIIIILTFVILFGIYKFIHIQQDIKIKKDKEIENIFQAIFQKANIGIILLDIKGYTQKCNKRTEEILGYNQNDLSKIRLGKIVHPEDYPIIKKNFKKLISEKQDQYKQECRFIKQNGTIITTSNTGTIITDENNEPRYILVLLEDITSKKIYETKFIETYQNLKAVYQGITDGLMIIESKTHKILKVNDTLCNMFNTDKETLLNSQFEDLHPKEDLKEILEKFMLATILKTALFKDITYIKKDKTIFYADVSSSKILYEEKECLIAFVRDITQRKNAEEELIKSKEKYRAIIEGYNGYILICNENKEIIFGNQKLTNIIGENLSDKKCHKELFGFNEPCKWCKETSNNTQNTIVQSPKDNNWYNITHKLLNNPDGTIHTLVMINDITELKNIQTELAKERQHLEETVEIRTKELTISLEKLKDINIRLKEANKHKENFISSVSHELRTPLNAIIGFTDLLAKKYVGDINEKQEEYIQLIHNSGKHLLELINDILNIAKIDAGKMELNQEKFKHKEVIDEIRNILKSQFNSKNLNVNCQNNSTITEIVADKKKFKQIILNILSNAIKYSKENGNIYITIESNNEFLIIAFKDEGVGIDDKSKNMIFSEFYQTNQNRDAALGGTGIGLSLTKRLVEIHNGSITVESELDKGSTFFIQLPIEGNQTLTNQIGDFYSDDYPQNKTIFIIEDEFTNNSMLKKLLNVHNHKTIIANNSYEALKFAKEHKPDLIFMDIILSDNDGIKEMQEIKDIPIVAIIAKQELKSQDTLLEKVFIEYIEKPFQSKQIFEALKNHIKS